ncbi:L,D-transpeptidase, partial [Haloferula helveola]|uniref:L,D-transpeptidase n=1 Tax=Haloferula helveola TaxID=490095 RepID=UPI00333E7B56
MRAPHRLVPGAGGDGVFGCLDTGAAGGPREPTRASPDRWGARGIHGTSDPETIGRARSAGCIRMANWDATR